MFSRKRSVILRMAGCLATIVARAAFMRSVIRTKRQFARFPAKFWPFRGQKLLFHIRNDVFKQPAVVYVEVIISKYTLSIARVFNLVSKSWYGYISTSFDIRLTGGEKLDTIFIKTKKAASTSATTISHCLFCYSECFKYRVRPKKPKSVCLLIMPLQKLML